LWPSRRSSGTSELQLLLNSSQMTMFGVVLKVARYDSICSSHRTNPSDLLRDQSVRPIFC
jgi:hypothetical protein